ncbi:ubiquitin carboxyl-terminal hydrolase 8-like [Antedon mediterranea]|uniref:ubiquitin carboxyl-terminal hydrolase 8-like n=1 Tax=Antedon mediterranea TaxID=105859 RepID=UPI003AF7B797
MPGEIKPKSLYIAESIKQLNEKGECDLKKTTSIKGLCTTAEKAYQEADKASKANDEERAYVLFVKYMNIFTWIKKHKEYIKDKGFYDSLLGSKRFVKAIEQAEQLQESLTKRYDNRKQENLIKEKQASEEQTEREKSRSEIENGVSDKEDTQTVTDVCSNVIGVDGKLNSFDLYHLLHNDNPSYLIIDVRTVEEYKMSHIKNDSCVINVPKSVITPGCTVAVIECGLPVESKHLWNKREEVDYIILIDWYKAPSSSIDSLKDALYKWDSSVTLKNEPIKLQGGYDDWLLRYPTFTTNSKVTPPVMEQNSSLKTNASLLNFDFPTLEDDEPKPPEPAINGQHHTNGVINGQNTAIVQNMLIADRGKPTPIIDRSSKPKPANQANIVVNESPKPVSGSPKPVSGQSKPSQAAVFSNTEKLDVKVPPVIIGAGDVTESVLQNQETHSVKETKTTIPQVNRSLKPNLGTTELVNNVNETSTVQEDIKPPEIEEHKENKLEVNQVDEQMQLQEKRLKSHKDKELQARSELDKLRAEKMKSENLEQKKTIEAMEEKIKNLERERKQFEEEKKILEDKAKSHELEKKMIEANKKKSQEELNEKKNEHKVVNQQLPSNWEKRFDEKSKKYYYIDHNTKKTSWTPPSNYPVNSSIPQTGSQSNMHVHVQDKPSSSSPQDQPSKTPTPTSSPSKASLPDKKSTPSKVPSQAKLPSSTKVQLQDQPKPKLTRSMSSPNIAQMVFDEGKASVTPTFDRNIKPLPSSRIQDSTKLAKSNRNLAGTYGGMGPGLTGLRNLGNTCFMNSVVQCLSNTKYLTDYFVGNIYQGDINRQNVLGRKGEVAEDYAVVIRALWSGQYRAVSPRDLSNTVIKYVPQFNQNVGHHHDSQEFLIFLMDGLHEDLNRVKKREYVEEKDNDLPDIQAANLAWNNYKRLNQSICVELFQGQYKSTVQCETCKNTMVKFDTYMYLSLPLPTKNKCSLKQCLEHFSKPEKLTGDNAVKCTRCKVKRNSIKTIKIWSTPPVLIIHLKRFYFEGRWRQKLQTNVDFPLTDLDLLPLTVGPKTRKSYFLYGVSCHTGGLDGGHYTAMCKHPGNKKWYKYDDHEVYDMPTSRAKQGSAAYILFYSSQNW